MRMKTLIVTAILSVILIVLFWCATPNLMRSAVKNDAAELGSRGVYGDQYGGLNALFTGLAFAGALTAILLQLIEMRQSEARGRKSAQAMNTLNLFNEWNDSSLREDRLKAEDWLKRDGNKELFNIDRMKGADQALFSAAVDIWTFFFKCAVYVATEQADNVLLKTVIGSEATWWFNKLLKPIRDSTSDGDNENFDLAYDQIKNWLCDVKIQ